MVGPPLTQVGCSAGCYYVLADDTKSIQGGPAAADSLVVEIRRDEESALVRQLASGLAERELLFIASCLALAAGCDDNDIPPRSLPGQTGRVSLPGTLYLGAQAWVYPWCRIGGHGWLPLTEVGLTWHGATMGGALARRSRALTGFDGAGRAAQGLIEAFGGGV